MMNSGMMQPLKASHAVLLGRVCNPHIFAQSWCSVGILVSTHRILHGGFCHDVTAVFCSG